MNEVEKMYALAMVAPTEITVCGIDEEIIHYPPFTAEKQIELIKWLGIRDELNLYQNKATNDWVFYDHEKDAIHYSFEQGLASWINYLWEDLTEEEKQQVKGILE